MSKLYNKYLSLKKENPDIIYLFKSGIFFICLEEDANTLSKEFGFKITNLNNDIVKCGFPQTRIDYYSSELEKRKIEFKITDSNYEEIKNYSDYINNLKVKQIINQLLEVDINNTTFKQAFEILDKLSQNAKEIYKGWLNYEFYK